MERADRFSIGVKPLAGSFRFIPDLTRAGPVLSGGRIIMNLKSITLFCLFA